WAEPFDSAPFDVDEFSIDLVSFLVQGGGQIDVGHGAEQFVPGTRLGRNADLQLFDDIGRYGGLPYDFFLLVGPLSKVFRQNFFGGWGGQSGQPLGNQEISAVPALYGNDIIPKSQFLYIFF